MKTHHFLFLGIALFMLMSCKSQEQVSSCENVTNPRNIPWLAQIIEKGESAEGAKLTAIERITYYIESSKTEGFGFAIAYEHVCCDIPYLYYCDCEGNVITFYGGIAGCSGECDITILSRKSIFSTE